jgi:hypothetical protein
VESAGQVVVGSQYEYSYISMKRCSQWEKEDLAPLDLDRIKQIHDKYVNHDSNNIKQDGLRNTRDGFSGTSATLRHGWTSPCGIAVG